jgi:hypothetical protein
MPTSLRRPDQRLALRQMADAILRADTRKQRGAATPKLAPKKPAPPPTGPRPLRLADLVRALSAQRKTKIKSTETCNGRASDRPSPPNNKGVTKMPPENFHANATTLIVVAPEQSGLLRTVAEVLRYSNTDHRNPTCLACGMLDELTEAFGEHIGIGSTFMARVSASRRQRTRKSRRISAPPSANQRSKSI